MNSRRFTIALAAFAGLVLAAGAALAQQRLYRWVDDAGVVHYGDRVPPEFAHRDREILNAQGVAIGFEEGEITEAERAVIERQRAAEEAVRLERERREQRDRMLLDTYLTVTDIEELRDRRLELLGSQIEVTELYLTNLRKRLVGLEREASAFTPYSANADAPPLPADLALEVSRAQGSITLYEHTLARTREEQERLRAAFDLDITRFRELKGG